MELNSIVNGILNFGIILLILLFVFVLIGFFIYALIQYKKWSQFKCIIWGRDGFGQLVEKTDRAGIFVDSKTKNKRFYLKKSNVGLDCNNIPYIQHGKQKRVYLLQIGLKNYKFIKPTISGDVFNFDVSEEDVNWAINAYDKQKKLFNQNILLQYMPFILLAFVSMIILIMFIYLFKQFPIMLQIAKALKEAATTYAQGQAGTVVLT